MVNPRQRRKARSSAHKTVKHSRHAKRNLKKMKPIRGPKALQDAWDDKKTLRQNYATLGLMGSLKQVDVGGSECPLPLAFTKSLGGAPAARSKPSTSKDEKLPQQHGKILRDEDGDIVGIEILTADAEAEEFGEEGDLADTEKVNDHVTGQKTDVVIALERLASSSRPISRWSSSGEITLLKNLLAKHGRDFEAMAKDRRLNSWQRTAGQLERASKKAGLV